jgi:hypothetical protein
VKNYIKKGQGWNKRELKLCPLWKAGISHELYRNFTRINLFFTRKTQEDKKKSYIPKGAYIGSIGCWLIHTQPESEVETT